MSLLDLNALPVQISRETIVGMAALHNICAWAFHITYTSVSPEKNRIHNLSVSAMTLITLSSVFFMVIPWLSSYNTWDLPITDRQCKWIVFATKLLFIYPKTMGVYVVYIERLFHIFKDNVYAFQQWQKSLLRGLLGAVTLLMTGILFLNVGTSYEFNPSNSTCAPLFDSKGVVTMIVIDFAICTLLSTLYCRRLLIYRTRLSTGFLAANATATGTTASNDDIDFRIMLKVTVLTFVAAFSTEFCVALTAVLGVPSLWAGIDSMVNSWCLILIFDIYDDLFRLYPMCCGLCEKLLCFQCILCYSCHWCCAVNHGVVAPTGGGAGDGAAVHGATAPAVAHNNDPHRVGRRGPPIPPVPVI